MSDLDDDLFSELEPIEAPKLPTPQTRTVPSLADSLHELGLAQNKLEPEQEPAPELEDAAEPEDEPRSEQEAAPEVVPTVETIDPIVVVEVEPLLHEVVDEEVVVEPVVEPEHEPVLDLEPEPHALLEPEAVVAKVDEEQPRVEPLSSQDKVAGSSRRWILISGGVAACAIAIGGWFLFGTTNKESPAEPHATVASAPTAEPMAMPEPASVAAPIAVEPEGVVEVEPVPTPATEPIVAPAASPEPAPVPQVKKVAAAPKPATAKTSRAKPSPAASPKAKPKAEPQWQDDALDALDDFEKRL